MPRPPLVMALLRPGIRKVDVDAVEAVRRNHLLQHSDCIVLDHADIVQPCGINLLEQAAHAGCVHLDADVVVAGMGCGYGNRCFPHAAADFEHARRAAAENQIEIDRGVPVFKAVTRQQGIVRTFLCIRHAALAQHVAAD